MVSKILPIGALTSKPYSFINRPWELKIIEILFFDPSIDDYYPINLGILNNEIRRVLPITKNRNIENIDYNWISDNVRFFFEKYDHANRRKHPALLVNYSNLPSHKCQIFIKFSWFKFLTTIASKISNFTNFSNISFNYSIRSLDLFSIMKLEKLKNRYFLNSRYKYISVLNNSENIPKTQNNISKYDKIFLIGFNPYYLNPRIDYLIRSGQDNNDFSVFAFMDTHVGIRFGYKNCISSYKEISNFFCGKHKWSKYINSKDTLVIVNKKFIYNILGKQLSDNILNTLYNINWATLANINRNIWSNSEFTNNVENIPFMFHTGSIRTQDEDYEPKSMITRHRSWTHKSIVGSFQEKNEINPSIIYQSEDLIKIKIQNKIYPTNFLRNEYKRIFYMDYLDFSIFDPRYSHSYFPHYSYNFPIFHFPISSFLEFGGSYNYIKNVNELGNYRSQLVTKNNYSKPLGVIVDVLDRRISYCLFNKHVYINILQFIIINIIWWMYFIFSKRRFWCVRFRFRKFRVLTSIVSHINPIIKNAWSDILVEIYSFTRSIRINNSFYFTFAKFILNSPNKNYDYFINNYVCMNIGFEEVEHSKTLTLINNSIIQNFNNFNK